MRTGLIALGCAALLWGAGASAADTAAPATTPTAPAAAPEHNHVCLDASNIDRTTYPDDNTILFHMKAGPVRVWKNSLPRTCHGLTFEQGIAYEINGGVICSNMQVVYVIHRWIPCFLGPFTPYTPPPKDKAATK